MAVLGTQRLAEADRRRGGSSVQSEGFSSYKTDRLRDPPSSSPKLAFLLLIAANAGAIRGRKKAAFV